MFRLMMKKLLFVKYFHSKFNKIQINFLRQDRGHAKAQVLSGISWR